MNHINKSRKTIKIVNYFYNMKNIIPFHEEMSGYWTTNTCSWIFKIMHLVYKAHLIYCDFFYNCVVGKFRIIFILQIKKKQRLGLT